MPLSPDTSKVGWHAFLSHAQATAGGQVFAVREALAAYGLEAWIDVDYATSAESMHQGVVSSAVFVCFLSRTVLARKYCQLELRAALNKRKPIVFVHEEDAAYGGAPIAEIVEEGRRISGNPDEVAAGRVLVSVPELDALFPGGQPAQGVVPFRRGAEFLSITIPELVRRIKDAAPKPFNLPTSANYPRLKLTRALSQAPVLRGGAAASEAPACDVLLVGGPSGTHQLLFLETALRARAGGGVGGLLRSCDGLPDTKSRFSVNILPPGSSRETGAAAARCAGIVVVLLTADLWGVSGVMDEGACAALLTVLQRHAQQSGTSAGGLHMLHEIDSRFGGVYPINALISSVRRN